MRCHRVECASSNQTHSIQSGAKKYKVQLLRLHICSLIHRLSPKVSLHFSLEALVVYYCTGTGMAVGQVASIRDHQLAEQPRKCITKPCDKSGWVTLYIGISNTVTLFSARPTTSLYFWMSPRRKRKSEKLKKAAAVSGWLPGRPAGPVDRRRHKEGRKEGRKECSLRQRLIRTLRLRARARRSPPGASNPGQTSSPPPPPGEQSTFCNWKLDEGGDGAYSGLHRTENHLDLIPLLQLHVSHFRNTE